MLDKNKNKLPFMKNTKTALFSSLLAGSVMLTACGGGGGGGSTSGGGTPPASEDRVDFDRDKILSGAPLEINFETAFEKSFEVTLNGTNITDLFDTNQSPATAKYNQVRSFLKDGENVLVVEVQGDRDEEKFNLDIIPGRVVITDAKVDGSDNIVKPGDQDVKISGFTRKANPSIAFFDNDINNTTDSTSNTPFEFMSSLLVADKADDIADYTFVASYDDFQQVTVRYAANGRNLKTLGGIQINNTAFDALEPFLADIVDSVVKESLPIFVPINQSNECLLTLVANNLCGLNLNKVNLTGDNLLDIKINKPVSAKVDENSGFEIELSFDLEGRDAAFDIIEYQTGFNFDALVDAGGDGIRDDLLADPNVYGLIDTNATFGIGSVLTIRMIASLDNGDIKLRFPHEQDVPDGTPENGKAAYSEAISLSLTIDENDDVTVVDCSAGTLESTPEYSCTDSNKLAISNAVKTGVINLNVDLDEMILDQADQGETSIRDYVATTFVQEPERPYNVLKKDPDAGEIVVPGCNGNAPTHYLTQCVTVLPDTVRTATDSTTSNNGGIISIGGGNHLVTSDAISANEFKRSLGSMMNLNQQSFRKNGDTNNISHSEGIAIALSVNFLNQMLMVAYQSGEFISNLDEAGPRLSDLGLNGATQIKANAKSQPFLELKPNNQAMLYVDNVDFTLLYDGANAVWGTIDVEMLMALKVENNKPSLKPVQDGVYIGNITSIQASDELKRLIAIYETFEGVEIDVNVLLVQMLPSEIEKMVSTMSNDLFDKLDTADIQVDVGEIVKGNLDSILPTPETFQLLLNDVVVDNDQTGIILKGDLREKQNAFSLLDLTFCKEVEAVTVEPGICQVKQASP